MAKQEERVSTETSMNVRILKMGEYENAVRKMMDAKLAAVKNHDYGFNTPTFVWGLPGVGKSKIIESICKDTWGKASDKVRDLEPWSARSWAFYSEKEKADVLAGETGWVLMDVRLSQIDPVELKGAPFYDIKNQTAKFVRFDELLPDTDFPCPLILLLDEFPQAPDLVQSAAYQLINEGRVGNHRLPRRCVTLAAGNPDSCQGVNFQLPLALETRFDHVWLDIDHQGFYNYMNKMGYDESLVSYFGLCATEDTDSLYKMNPGMGNMPNFRSWEKVAKKLQYGFGYEDAIADSVGKDAVAKFMVFKRMTKDIPEAETLIKKKTYYSEISKQIVACQKIANVIQMPALSTKKSDRELWDMFQYFYDMHNPSETTDLREELSMMFMLNLRKNVNMLDRVDKGYSEVLKSGEFKAPKDNQGKKVEDLFLLLLYKWPVMKEMD